MKIRDLTTPLHEAPLPPDWEKSTYSPQTSFKKQLAYTMDRAAKLGTGSGRVAFTIQYEGRPTVLKIAKNQKGLAQNEFEAQMFSDYYASGIGITIPMIDYDEENEPPRWIHTEKANKVKPTQFAKHFGVSHNEISRVLQYATGQLSNSPMYGNYQANYGQVLKDNENLQNLVELVGNYGLPTGDFPRLANWGEYKGNLVIIDIGLSQDVLKQYYGG